MITAHTKINNLKRSDSYSRMSANTHKNSVLAGLLVLAIIFSGCSAQKEKEVELVTSETILDEPTLYLTSQPPELGFPTESLDGVINIRCYDDRAKNTTSVIATLGNPEDPENPIRFVVKEFNYIPNSSGKIRWFSNGSFLGFLPVRDEELIITSEFPSSDFFELFFVNFTDGQLTPLHITKGWHMHYLDGMERDKQWITIRLDSEFFLRQYDKTGNIVYDYKIPIEGKPDWFSMFWFVSIDDVQHLRGGDLDYEETHAFPDEGNTMILKEAVHGKLGSFKVLDTD